MARSRNKKTKIQQLLESQFEVTFFHKPSYVGDDVYHYAILNNRIRIRFRMFQKVMVIDEITSLTSISQVETYKKLGDLLVNQNVFSVLVSIIGDTRAFHTDCARLTDIIIEDENYITVSKQFYQRIKVFYQNDPSKYGFYLLAAADDDIPQEPDAEVIEEVVDVPEIIEESEPVQKEPIQKTDDPDKTINTIQHWASGMKYGCYNDSHGIIQIQAPVFQCKIYPERSGVVIHDLRCTSIDPNANVSIIRFIKYLQSLCETQIIYLRDITDLKVQDLCNVFNFPILPEGNTAWTKSYQVIGQSFDF